jgi:putative inorganic carbon (hco3(-)) transporter
LLVMPPSSLTSTSPNPSSWVQASLSHSALLQGVRGFEQSLQHAWTRSWLTGWLSLQQGLSLSQKQRAFLSLSLEWGLWALLGIGCFQSTGLFGAGVLAMGLYAIIVGFCLNGLRWLHRPTLTELLAFAYFAWMIVATAFSSYQPYSWQGLLKGGTFLAGFFALRTLWDVVPNARFRFYGVLSLALLAQVAICLWQLQVGVTPLATWSDGDTNPELQIARVYGSIQPFNPNLLAGFLLASVLAPLGVYRRLLDKVSQPSRCWPWAILCAAASLGGLWAIQQSGSRGAYLSIAVAGAILLPLALYLLTQLEIFQKKPKLSQQVVLSILGALLVGLSTLLAVSPALRTRLLSMTAMREDSSISYRLNVYQSCGTMAQDNLLTGIGPGNATFKQVYGLYMVPGYNALGCYSVPLEVLCELGLIGLLLFLGLWLSLGGQALGLLSTTLTPLLFKWEVLISLATLVGFIGQGVFDTVWYRPLVQWLFWAWASLLMAAPQWGLARQLEPTDLPEASSAQGARRV